MLSGRGVVVCGDDHRCYACDTGSGPGGALGPVPALTFSPGVPLRAMLAGRSFDIKSLHEVN